ncbi:MAG TPA: methyl-accepting chemotaxis protein [Candidatus Acidoferrales bacterium]|jgi:methyl-accepting chemotaxis protein|nr:methyl-accepting chemotaxis protein [Candidatus Acidoferrales bacterium]
MPGSHLESAAKPELAEGDAAISPSDQSPTSHSEVNRVAELEAELESYRALFHQVSEITSQAAQGNLEMRLLHCDGSERSREVSRSVNHLLDMTDAFLRESGAALEHASHEKFFRRVLLRGMRGTFRDKSELINQAMDRMKGNSSSLQEAERLIYSSARMAQGAVAEAEEAKSVVTELGDASGRIDAVLKQISKIAWQTKLLAFNARIEACHAGEAGRGFEVVAQEVKNLAQQTASATDDISREITAISEEVTRTTQAIEAIGKTIGQMQEVSANIRVVSGNKDAASSEKSRRRPGISPKGGR